MSKANDGELLDKILADDSPVGVFPSLIGAGEEVHDAILASRNGEGQGEG
jgi:hypothetical protein